MHLAQELDRIAAAAAELARGDDVVAAVIPAEPASGVRVYLCAFTDGEQRSWLVLDRSAQPVHDRGLIRDAVSIAALCEVAEDGAAGGRPADVRAHLQDMARIEGRQLGDGVEAAISQLEAALEAPPRVASGAYLDRLGVAARALEQALGEIARSPFAEAMKQASLAVEGLTAEVEAGYRVPIR